MIGDSCFTGFSSLQTSADPLEITVGNEEGFKNLTQLLEENSDALQIPIAVCLEN